MKKKIKKILEHYYHGPHRILMNPHYSSENRLFAAVPGSKQWFFIQANQIKQLKQIGYFNFDGESIPLVEIQLKREDSSLNTLLRELWWNTINKDMEMPIIPSENITGQFTKDNKLTKELSGSQWVARFPGSSSIADLSSPFRDNVTNFNNAITAAGGTISIIATYRPAERAYLMQTSFDIANGTINAGDAPTLAGVDIEWVHPTNAQSVQAAKDMVSGYRIGFRPAFPTKHSDRTAIDMNISWSGTLKIKKADGTEVSITSAPRDNDNADLQAVGLTYDVHKLIPDKQHWSDDGH